MECIHRALVLGLVLIAGTAIEQAPSVGPLLVCHQYDVCVNYVGSVYIMVCAKADSVSSINCVQSDFL